jgi:hypothetical protein
MGRRYPRMVRMKRSKRRARGCVPMTGPDRPWWAKEEVSHSAWTALGGSLKRLHHRDVGTAVVWCRATGEPSEPNGSVF